MGQCPTLRLSDKGLSPIAKISSILFPRQGAGLFLLIAEGDIQSRAEVALLLSGHITGSLVPLTKGSSLVCWPGGVPNLLSYVSQLVWG